MLKFILKILSILLLVIAYFLIIRIRIWPAFLPLIAYFIWVKVSEKMRKKDYIDGEYKIVDENKASKEQIGAFSLKNSKFVYILFSTFLLIIFGLIFIALTTKPIKSVADKPVEQKIIVE